MTKHITKRIERKKEKLEDLLQQVDNLTDSIETDQRIEKKYKSYKTEYELIKRQERRMGFQIPPDEYKRLYEEYQDEVGSVDSTRKIKASGVLSIPHEDEITLLANRIKDIHKSEEKIKSNVN
jgi:HAMP domain-containing protein